jgi:hypothetical protein
MAQGGIMRTPRTCARVVWLGLFLATAPAVAQPGVVEVQSKIERTIAEFPYPPGGDVSSFASALGALPQ